MTPLPDDIDQLKRMVWQLQAEKQSQAEQIHELQISLAQALEQLKLSKSKRFGRQSEKTPRGTFNEAERDAKPEPEHHKKGRKSLPDHLEREERRYTLDEPVCECCHAPMHVCGTEESEQLKIIPEKISVIRHLQTKYGCRQCERTEISTRIVTASKPAQPIPGSIASPDALAAVVTGKYCDALPLYRQEAIFRRGGLEISRSTLANWCIKAGMLIQPLLAALKKHLLHQQVLCADETTVQVLDEPDRDACAKSYMWVYRSHEFSEQPVVLYDYQPGRGQIYPQTYLKGFTGTLVCDGYQAYAAVENVTLAGCWAHVRRKFHDAQLAQPKKTGKATVALNMIQKLYAIEKKAKELIPDERRQVRQEEARPVLDKFKTWLDKSIETITAKSYLGKALNYTLNQWPKLLTYLDDGHVSIDNNVTERDIRPFTTGRKNWLFASSVEGVEASAALYSIVMTCRANDINPYFYFRHLFTALPQRSEGADLSDLLPWHFSPA